MQAITGNIASFKDICSKEGLDYESLVNAKREQQIEALRENGGWVPIDQPEEEVKKVKRMSKPRRKNWMRNKPCLCGSGRKFKLCCWGKYA